MSKKKAALIPPSQQSMQLVMQQAASAPLQNMQHAAAVHKAINEVSAFFQQLMAPQSVPQASARGPGNSSVQS